MFVYRPIKPSDKAFVFAGSRVESNSGVKYLTGSTTVDSGATITALESFLGTKSTPVVVDSGSTFTGFGNRKYTTAVLVDSRSALQIRFVPMTSLSVYDELGFVANTRDLTFSGSAVTTEGGIVSDMVTVEGTGVAYAKRVDVVSNTVTYKGQAAAGSTDSAASWRISRVTTTTDGDIVQEWAAGVSAFENVWDDRLTLVYS